MTHQYTVQEFNDCLFHNGLTNLENEFIVSGNGSYELIMFGDWIIYNSSEDAREWNEEMNCYESIEPFILREFSKRIDELLKIQEVLTKCLI